MSLKIEDSEKDYVIVGDGSQTIVHIHKINIKVADIVFNAAIGFSRYLGIGFNVIGQKDVFDRFKICFDKSEKVVEFIKK